MGIIVKTIDEQAIIKDLKASGKKEAVNYIKKLKEALKRQQELTNLATSKLESEYDRGLKRGMEVEINRHNNNYGQGGL